MRNQPPSVIFRADGSPTIGLGHLVRCSALAVAIRLAGWHTVLATATPNHVPPFAASAFDEIIPLKGKQAEEIDHLAAKAGHNVDLLIVDHYGRDASFEKGCKTFVRRVCAIDDFGTRDHAADILVDQNLGVGPSRYAAMMPDGAQIFCGPDNAMLRAGFASARAQELSSPERARNGKRLQHILLSPGATDTAGLAELLLPSLLERGHAIDVLLSREAAGFAGVAALAKQHGPLNLYADADDSTAARLMTKSDLAISAAGSTVWELCALGVPSLLIQVADNQQHIAEALSAASFAIDLGRPDASLIDRVLDSAATLERDPTRLAKMRQKAMLACDGLGAFRLALALIPEEAHGGEAVTLRRAVPEDRDRLLGWQSEPGFRRHSRNPDTPTPEEHDIWYARKLDNPACIFSIVEKDGVAAGFLRLDLRPRQSQAPAFEVSIGIPQEFQRAGIGVAALRAARRLVPFARLDAFIAEANDASYAAFKRAGYLPSGGNWYYNTPILDSAMSLAARD